MMRVVGVRSKVTPVGEELEARDAELVIESMEGRCFVKRYLHVNAFLSKHYSLSEHSIFAYMTGEQEEPGDVDFIEEFQDLEQAKYSAYGVFYEMADRIVEELGHRR